MFTLTKELYIKGWTSWGSRATRREYWLGGLGWALMMIPLVILMVISMDFQAITYANVNPYACFTPLTWGLYGLIIALTFIPGIGSYVRRLHDIGRSGWWYLLMFIISMLPILSIIGLIWFLVWFCQDSEPRTNKWGMSPKYKV